MKRLVTSYLLLRVLSDAEVHIHGQTEIDPETDQPVERKQRDQARDDATEELDDVLKRAISLI